MTSNDILPSMLPAVSYGNDPAPGGARESPAARQGIQSVELAMTVLQAGSQNPVVAYPNEVLYDAAARMLRSKVGRLPVASWEEPGKPVGYLGRSEVMAARLRRLEEEYVREPGWWRRKTTPA